MSPILLTGQLTEAVRRKPYGWCPISQDPYSCLIRPFSAIILLDELEKAHKVCCNIRMIVEYLVYT